MVLDLTDNRNGKARKKRSEQTVAQVLFSAGPTGDLPPNTLALPPQNDGRWYNKVRHMRRDPTIGFLRSVYMAPIIAAEWTVVSDDPKFENAVPGIVENTVRFRTKFLRHTMRGLIDYGWQSFEVVRGQRATGELYVEKLKPLLPDLTEILVDPYGNLVGLKNDTVYSNFVLTTATSVYLYRGECIVLYRDAEGTNWYGEPLARRYERSFNSWNESDDAARRFDNKVAGASWVVYYPEGTSTYNGLENTDNATIAKDIAAGLVSSGKVVVPNKVMNTVDALNGVDPSRAAWRIELLSANTQQATFVDRGKYLDSLKARAMDIPERAIFEGQFGTKAEAEAHADFAIDNLEMAHQELLELFNEQYVDYLLEVNHGPDYKEKVRVVATPLTDQKRNLVKKLYDQHWASQTGQAQESDAIDWSAIRDQLGVPIRKDYVDQVQKENQSAKSRRVAYLAKKAARERPSAQPAGPNPDRAPTPVPERGPDRDAEG